MELTDLERRILRELQRDQARSLTEIAQAVAAAPTTVWRRIQALEGAGLVTGRVALLDPRKLRLKLCVFAQVTLADHSEDALAGFARIIRTEPRILEAHALSGTADYMLKIRCADVEEYEGFLTRALLRSPFVGGVVSAFSLKELKYTTELPL